MDELTETETAILDFERQWWTVPGGKEQAIRDRFDLTATAYYRLLSHLIDRPEALAHDPMVVHRLQRLRLQGARRRRGQGVVRTG